MATGSPLTRARVRCKSTRRRKVSFPAAAGRGKAGRTPQLTDQVFSVVAGSTMRGRQQGVQGSGGDANCVQNSHVREDAACAERVDGRVRYAEQLGHFADREQTIAATWEPRGREQNRSKIFRKRCFRLRSAGNAIAETRMIS